MAARFLIQGPGAKAAADELAATSGLGLSIEPIRRDTTEKDLDADSVVAIITAVVGTSVTVADNVLRWIREHRRNHTGVDRAALVVAGRPYDVETLTADRLAALLRQIELDDRTDR